MEPKLRAGTAAKAAPARTGTVPDDLVRQELERILQSNPFRHSRRSQNMLRHVVEKALAGHLDELKERTIAVELFSRDPGYDAAEDAIVRVSANDVRKRLGEYYRGAPAGIVRIRMHSGSYVPEFEPLETPESTEAPRLELAAAVDHGRRTSIRARWTKGYTAAVVLFLLGLVAGLSYRDVRAHAATENAGADPPWPLSRVFDAQRRTLIVMGDANAGLLGVIRGKPIQLEEYLQPGFLANMLPPDDRQSGIANMISRTQFTSFADLGLVLRIAKLAGRFSGRLELRFARDLRMRELRDNNFILLGSPLSNPWVSVFSSQLNFHEEVKFPELREFVNRSPARAEQARYRGIPWTGSAGEEFATISLVPNETRQGSVLILQGLHQEGTEAAGILIATEEGQRELKQALKIGPPQADQAWFEALIRMRAAAGAIRSTEVVATRTSGIQNPK